MKTRIRSFLPDRNSSLFRLTHIIRTGQLPWCGLAKFLICSGAPLLSWSEANSQPAPHHFETISAAPTIATSLTLGGSVSNMFQTLPVAVSNQFRQMFDVYVVNTSSDLKNWTRLGVLIRTNADAVPLRFDDPEAAGLTHRFYHTPTNALITGFPKPTGPFAVGTCSRILTDASRTNRYGLKTNSSFMSSFWYPALPPSASSLPNSYTDAGIAADGVFLSNWGFARQWTNVLSRCASHSFLDAPFLPGTNRCPVILYSHGYSCDRRLNSQAAEELASHGYIVVAVDHEDCHATVFPDSRGARYRNPATSVDAFLLFKSRTNDIQFLLGELPEFDRIDALMKGRFDLDRIGIMGMSFGGMVAADTGRVDSRVKCVALLDAALALYTNDLPKPFLSMNRTILDHGIEDLAPGPWRLYTLATTNAIWLKIKNTGHFTFTDFAWMVEITPDSRPGAMAIDACLLSFFNRHLREIDDGLFSRPEGMASWPQILDFRAK